MRFEACFEPYIADKLAAINDLREVRVRDGAPIVLNVGGKRSYLSNVGLSASSINAISSAKSCNQIVNDLCCGSIYAYEKMLASGFMTLEGGVRVGVCGSVVGVDKGMLFKQYSSLCFRIPHDIEVINDETLRILSCGNFVVVGAPRSGKTTFIKCFAKKMSRLENVLVADERGELCDIVGCDVLSFAPKNYVFEVGIRSLSPDWVVCDELAAGDIPSLMRCAQSGVKVAATMHGDSYEDFLRLFGKDRYFDKVVLLGKSNNKMQLIDVK